MISDRNQYKKLLSPRLVKEAAALKVRESDEDGPGHFIAFVDDGASSFDVSLRFGADGALLAHSCDCGGGDRFCKHRAALLLQVTSAESPAGKPEPLVKGRAKKRSELEELLEETGEQQLRAWLALMLKTHKDVALAFRAHFGRKNEALTPEQIRKQTAEAVKTVAGRQQSVDATQVKKIIALWSDLHEPVLRHYLEAVYDPERFQCLQALFAAIAGFARQYYISSKKLQQYVESIQRRVVGALKAVEENGNWERAAGFFFDGINENNDPELTEIYFEVIKGLAELESVIRRARLAELFIVAYRRLLSEHVPDRSRLVKFAVNLFDTCGVTEQYLDDIPALAWSPEHNERLLRALIASGKTGRAEQIAWQQIQHNRNEMYDLPYLEILRDIYRQQDNEAGLTDVLTRILLIKPVIDDYAFVAARLDEQQLQTLRSRLMGRGSAPSNSAGRAFLCAVHALDGNWKKILALLKSSRSPAFLLPWLEPLKQFDAPVLLNALLTWEDPAPYLYGGDDARPQEAELAQRLIELYGREAVKAGVEKHRKTFGRPGRIWALADEALRTSE